MTDNPLSVLEPLLADPHIMEIMIDGYDHVLVDRNEKLELVPSPFESEDHLKRVIDAIAEPLGRVVNESHPIVDLHLQDGTRVHVVAPPIALNGYSMVMRKVPANPVTLDKLINDYHSLSADMVEFLRMCVAARLNILVSGGTGAGKTTILNIIADMIPDDERIIVIQREMWVKLSQPHAVFLESRPANLEGRGEITLQQLITSATKMRPDRIIVSEVSGAEMLDVMTAMNTGHDGTLFTMHSISPRDALARAELLAASANPTLQLGQIREMMSTALDIIVQIDRLPNGNRKITRISEVAGHKNDFINLQDIFTYRREQDDFSPTGQIPQCVSRFQALNLEFDVQKLFAPR